MSSDTISLIKDYFYLIGSCLGIITFFMTIRKRDKCMFTYRTEMGNESRPMLICIRGNMYTLKISNNKSSHYAHKLPASFKFSSIRENEYEKSEFDESSFFACLREGEALLINNDNLDLCLKLEYEDQFRNKYFQTFNLQKNQIGNPGRFKKNKSQSLYKLSKRKKRFLWVWH